MPVDVGDLTAPIGSRPWCLGINERMRLLKRNGQAKVSALKAALLDFRDSGFFETLTDADGKPFQSWAAFVQCREPFGLGMDADVAAAIMAEPDEKRSIESFWDNVQPIARHGTNQHNKKGPYPVRSFSRYGNDVSYLAARIKRDRPDIAARIDDYPTIKAAARQPALLRRTSRYYYSEGHGERLMMRSGLRF